MNKKLITQIIMAVLFIFIFIIGIITTVSSINAKNLAFMNYRFYSMKFDNQPEIAKYGDLVIAKKSKIEEVNTNDKIVYGNGNVYHCDKIIEIKESNSVSKAIISEKDGIKYQLSENDISGKVVKTIPKLGSTVTVMRSTLGIIITVILIICIFILLCLIMLKNTKKQNAA